MQPPPLNSALGKAVLALLRDADYAHAGEEEAIVRAFAGVPHHPDQRLLDAGCGRGGTARYVQDRGWGRVSGCDIEVESIVRAKTLHPDLDLIPCDVLEVERHFPADFDGIYLFNAFYAFPDQPGVLRALRRVAKPGAWLMIFDYTDGGGFAGSPFAKLEESRHWRPIRPKEFPALLGRAGWSLEREQVLDEEYVRWYGALVARIDERRDAVIALAGEPMFRHALEVYSTLLEALRRGAVGGRLFYARATVAND